MDEEKLVTVARFENYIEAELAKQELNDNGIKAVVMGENVGNVYAGAPVVQDIELQTLEHDAKKAQKILRDRD
jgi:hypothetical protein